MFKTDNQEVLSTVLQAFSAVTEDTYGSYAFEAGYLQSVIISILPDLPKRKQTELIQDMVRAVKKQAQIEKETV